VGQLLAGRLWVVCCVGVWVGVCEWVWVCVGVGVWAWVCEWVGGDGEMYLWGLLGGGGWSYWWGWRDD